MAGSHSAHGQYNKVLQAFSWQILPSTSCLSTLILPRGTIEDSCESLHALLSSSHCRSSLCSRTSVGSMLVRALGRSTSCRRVGKTCCHTAYSCHTQQNSPCKLRSTCRYCTLIGRASLFLSVLPKCCAAMHRGTAPGSTEGSACSRRRQAAEAKHSKAAQVCCRLLPNGLCREAMPVQCTHGIGEKHMAALRLGCAENAHMDALESRGSGSQTRSFH